MLEKSRRKSELPEYDQRVERMKEVLKELVRAYEAGDKEAENQAEQSYAEALKGLSLSPKDNVSQPETTTNGA